MLRLLGVLTLPALVLLAAPAAPVPKAKPHIMPTCFPTTVGDTWVEHSEPSTVNGDITQTVTAVEKKGGDTVVTFALALGNLRLAPEKVRVSEAGIFRDSVYSALQGDWVDYTPPLPILKYPITVGHKWKVKSATMDSVWTGSAVIAKIEEVEVPAGKFKAVRIEADLTSNGRSDHVTFWYAPRVGLVKCKSARRTIVLKSFTPGGD